MNSSTLALIVMAAVMLLVSTEAFTTVKSQPRVSKTALNMGFLDSIKKGFENDSNLAPKQDAGLSNKADPVEVTFMPSGNKIQAYPNQDLKNVARDARVKIAYNCQKGDCGTCTVQLNGKAVKACQTIIPNKVKKLTVKVPQ